MPSYQLRSRLGKRTEHIGSRIFPSSSMNQTCTGDIALHVEHAERSCGSFHSVDNHSQDRLPEDFSIAMSKWNNSRCRGGLHSIADHSGACMLEIELQLFSPLLLDRPSKPIPCGPRFLQANSPNPRGQLQIMKFCLVRPPHSHVSAIGLCSATRLARLGCHQPSRHGSDSHSAQPVRSRSERIFR